MNDEDFIKEYKTLAKHCAKTDYSDKNSVKKHNASVKRMYEIVESLKESKSETIKMFELLDETEYKTNLWFSSQILEKLKLEENIERKALNIIEKAANGNDINAFGFKIWLENFKMKR